MIIVRDNGLTVTLIINKKHGLIILKIHLSKGLYPNQFRYNCCLRLLKPFELFNPVTNEVDFSLLMFSS